MLEQLPVDLEAADRDRDLFGVVTIVLGIDEYDDSAAALDPARCQIKRVLGILIGCGISSPVPGEDRSARRLRRMGPP